MKAENLVFARNLKHFIVLSGKEQKQICADLGMPESSMSDYVRGKSIPRYRTVERIADYFGVKMSDMMLENAPDNLKAHQRISCKLWLDQFPDIVWSTDEMQELIRFGEYLLTKRGR